MIIGLVCYDSIYFFCYVIFIVLSIFNAIIMLLLYFFIIIMLPHINS